MKLKNASERKRIRQLGALERLRKGIPSQRRAHEIVVLKERTQYSLRDIRTKKERGMS